MPPHVARRQDKDFGPVRPPTILLLLLGLGLLAGCIGPADPGTPTPVGADSPGPRPLQDIDLTGNRATWTVNGTGVASRLLVENASWGGPGPRTFGFVVETEDANASLALVVLVPSLPRGPTFHYQAFGPATRTAGTRFVSGAGAELALLFHSAGRATIHFAVVPPGSATYTEAGWRIMDLPTQAVAPDVAGIDVQAGTVWRLNATGVQATEYSAGELTRSATRSPIASGVEHGQDRYEGTLASRGRSTIHVEFYVVQRPMVSQFDLALDLPDARLEGHGFPVATPVPAADIGFVDPLELAGVPMRRCMIQQSIDAPGPVRLEILHDLAVAGDMQRQPGTGEPYVSIRIVTWGLTDFDVAAAFGWSVREFNECAPDATAGAAGAAPESLKYRL